MKTFFSAIVLLCLLRSTTYSQTFYEPGAPEYPLPAASTSTPAPTDYLTPAGSMSETVLKNYLKRNIGMFMAIQAPGMSQPSTPVWGYFLNFIQYIKPKYIGNVASLESDYMGLYLNPWLSQMQRIEKDVHNIDPQIILEANLLEFVNPHIAADGTYRIWIPDWLRLELPEISPTLSSYFESSQMATNSANPNFIDITSPMTLAWMYYFGRQYIDLGYEALTVNQVNAVAGDDHPLTNGGKPDFYWTNYLVSKLRNYASVHGRRKFILMVGGPINPTLGGTNNLIFDTYNGALGLRETHSSTGTTSPYYGRRSRGSGMSGGLDYEALIGIDPCANTGQTLYTSPVSGNHPKGWWTNNCPYMVQMDIAGGYENWLCNGGTTQPCHDNTFSVCHFPWGWDEFTWYSQQSELYRNQFLIYAWHKVRCLDNAAGYFQISGNRPYLACSSCNLVEYRAYNSPGGTYQAQLIKNIWDANDNSTPSSISGIDMRYYNRWANSFFQSLHFSAANMPTGKCYFGDFNGDGLIDVLETADPSKPGVWSGWKIYLMTGGVYSSTPNYSGTYPSWGERYLIGDYDGDGKDEFLVTSDAYQGIYWAGWELYKFNPSLNTYAMTNNGTDPSWGERLYVGDFNGDNKDDFLVTADELLTTGYSWVGYKIFTSSGNGFSQTLQKGWPGYFEDFYIGDFNGDNLDEFIITGNEYTDPNVWDGYKVYQNTGSDFIQVGYNNWPSWGENFIINDWNRDGHDDYTIVASGQNSVNWQGSKTYLCNDLGNHFIYSFDYSGAGFHYEPDYASEKLFGFRNGINNLVSYNSSSHSFSVFNPLHCNMTVWNSAKYGDTTIDPIMAGLSRDMPIVPGNLSPETARPDIKSDNTADLRIYPNPSYNGHFFLDLNGMRGAEIVVYNLDGKEIYNVKTTPQTVDIDLTKFPNGNYLIKIRNEMRVINKRITLRK